jgi:selenocysteine lyase/cysteine desulfurase
MRPTQWEPAGPYLNTASYGLPPRVAWDELQSALDDWRGGRTSWEHWGESTERARRCFGRLHGVPATSVVVGATVSELVGLVAASIADGAEVLTAEGDFASLLFPWAVQGGRGVQVRSVPLRALADAVEPGTDVVAVSVVQSASGELVDLGAVIAAAREGEALVVVDATQACGWLPLAAGDVDAFICAGYKWLLAPRGTAYLYVGERLEASLRPLHAGWYAGADVHASYYGLPPRLASSARRFDTSPAWFSWVGAAPALELLEEIGVEAIREHNLRLANRFRAGLALDPSDSAIVTTDVPEAAERLEAAGIRAATRAGSLRASFHLYNTEDDVDAALAALTD